MRYRRTRTFHKDLQNLPGEIKERAAEKFKLFQENPFPPYHPSLRIKPMKGWDGIFEGHVSRQYVFTFHKETDSETGEIIFVFRRIGGHEIYDSP